MAIYKELLVDQLKNSHFFVIYESGSKKTLPKKAKARKWQKLVGLLFIIISLSGILSLVAPLIVSEISFQFPLFRRQPLLATLENDSQKGTSRFGELLWLDEKDIVSPADWQFSLIIPKINVNTPVIANVDPVNEKEYYQALRKGVAHARGTSFPGIPGTVFIFGHSSGYLWERNRYSTVFYPLKNLKAGDEIIIFYANKKFVYQVLERKIIEANEVSLLSSGDSDKLILQTCWPPFTNWKRLIVVARPVV